MKVNPGWVGVTVYWPLDKPPTEYSPAALVVLVVVARPAMVTLLPVPPEIEPEIRKLVGVEFGKEPDPPPQLVNAANAPNMSDTLYRVRIALIL